MRKSILFIAILAFSGLNEAICQWTTSGSNIYNSNSGYVGIGNNSPSTLLHVAKNMTEPTITVQNLGGSGGATYSMVDNFSGADWKFKATQNGGFKIRDHSNGLDVFFIEQNATANLLYLKSGGRIGIGTSTPDNSALIDMNSTDKGFLLPRMTITQRNAIALPATGLLIFQTDLDSCFFYNAGTPQLSNWKKIDIEKPETDPVWSAVSDEYYTKINMQTSGSAQLHFSNLTSKPTTVAGYGITDAATVSVVQSGGLSYNITTGSANSYSISLSPVITNYSTGMLVNFKANFTNTGPATLDIDGLGIKPIKKSINISLTANDIKIGQIVTVVYDGVNFQMTNSGTSVSISGSNIPVYTRQERNELYSSFPIGTLIYNITMKRLEYKDSTHMYFVPGNQMPLAIPLTYPGSNHYECDCTDDGGTIVSISEYSSTYTLCKFASANPPAGWTQASFWQKYSNSSLPMDACGRTHSTVPTSFANQSGQIGIQGGTEIHDYWGSCSEIPVSEWAFHFPDRYRTYTISYGEPNPPTYRIEIGGK